MQTYRIAGLTVRSELPLPELPFHSSDDADWLFVGGHRLNGEGAVPFVEILDPGGDVTVSLVRREDGYLMRFVDLADFVIDTRRRRIEFCAADGIGDNMLRHLFLDQVIPHLLTIDGTLVLHGSAVAVGGSTLAFIGPSGAGKSSLAAGFVRDGAILLSDDFLQLYEKDRLSFVTPSYPGLRLWPDAMAVFAGEGATHHPISDSSDKARVAIDVAENLRERSYPLAAILVLDLDKPENDRCTVTRLSGVEAFMAVYRLAFRVERSGELRQRSELDRVAQLIESTPIFQLRFPRDYSRAAELRGDILRALKGTTDL